jgi:hypothetical protein
VAKRKSSTQSSAYGDLERELIVIAKPDARLRATPEGSVRSLAARDITALTDMFSTEDVSFVPLFGVSEDRLLHEATTLVPTFDEPPPDFSVYYKVDAPDDRLEELEKRLLQDDAVEGAYIKPPAEPAMASKAEDEPINVLSPAVEEAPPATPDFAAHQIYLNAAPAGIDARYAWTRSGGRGAGVRVIDIEGAWRFTHEDLKQNQGGVVGTQSTSLGWRNHGTAVIGEIGGDHNTVGILGISPDANTRAVSIFGGLGSAGALRQAADLLQAGDIILIELHRGGPNATGSGQFGFIAIEWWPDDYAAIRYAINKGIIVVEAAGNGSQDLDAAVYNQRPAGFPTSWKNPFNPANPTSGAVIVGAGAPPPGTHGRDHGPDRSRLGFSNYGRRVDCQGWGREVTTTGYGDLQGGTNEDLWYTNQFSGTSSASPIVVGALACVQGVLRSQGGALLTPAKAITALRATGSPQQDAPSRPATQRIGNRPDLRQLISSLANMWQYNKRVVRVHVKDGSRQAWAIVEGSGWLRIRPTSTDGVTNLLVIMCEALANDRRVDVYISNGEISQATLR